MKELTPEGTIITGIDLSEEALAEARREITSGNVEFMRMDGEKLNFEDQTLGEVCLSNAMRHLANPEKTLAEIKQIIRGASF